MLADGGECVSDLGVVRDQAALFGAVASDSTAFRVIDRIACDAGAAGRGCGPRTRGARERFWELAGAPERLTIDLDATLITAHSEKEGAAGNYKGGYGFHPMLAYADETREALAGELRPGNAGVEHRRRPRRGRRAGARADPRRAHRERSRSWCAPTSAGATHELLGLVPRGTDRGSRSATS